MKRLGEAAARAEQQLAQGASDMSVGQCVTVNDASVPPMVQVNLGGGVQWMPYTGARPWPGERVLVGYLGRKPVCHGPIYGHPLGTVVSVASGIVTVTGDDGQTYRYSCAFADTLSTSNRVAMHHAARQVIHRMSAEPPGSTFTPPPEPPPVSVVQTRTFSPIDSGDWYYSGSRWYGQEPTISENHAGFYFYGTQIADTIPDTATIISATMWLVELWDNVPGTPSQLGSHGNPTKPGFAPGLSGSLTVNNTGNYDVSSFANALKTGAQFGLGFYRGNGSPGTGYRAYGTYAQSGAITITWS
ncbi:hypothetical protein [Agromyces aureus]|uniref:Uncharacterized protein n=1 Tax=Agromyces aureus TaxID=453304 RepID=A0A191WF25_9MICO|nr:hypothetical protein [Agromyces aureus]ANJ26827.1 hypothetical protein ATC03_08945 [Agromyces aureus]